MHALFPIPRKQHAFHLVHRVLLHVRQYVRIGVQRELYARMPEHLRNDLRMHPRREDKCRACMPQIAKADGLRQACLFQKRLEVPVPKTIVLQGLSVPGSEHQIEILILDSRPEPLGCLPTDEFALDVIHNIDVQGDTCDQNRSHG